MRWERRDKKLRKRKEKIIKHGKAFGEMVRNAVRKRQEAAEARSDRDREESGE